MNGVFDVSELSLGLVELLVCFLESSSSSISFVTAFSSSFDVVVFWDIFYIVWCIFFSGKIKKLID